MNQLGGVDRKLHPLFTCVKRVGPRWCCHFLQLIVWLCTATLWVAWNLKHFFNWLVYESLSVYQSELNVTLFTFCFQISFSQFPKIDLVHFFITFFRYVIVCSQKDYKQNNVCFVLLHAAGACDFYFMSCLAMAVSLVKWLFQLDRKKWKISPKWIFCLFVLLFVCCLLRQRVRTFRMKVILQPSPNTAAK